MASYVDQHIEALPSDDDIKDMMLEKAHELFGVCDKEEKGFINKRDMQRLQGELPLSEDQLEAVFDSLDDDGNGFLTLEEFTGGFGSFIGLTTPAMEKQESLNSSLGSGERIYENEHLDDSDDEESFHTLVDTIGAHSVFEDMEVVKSLWSRIRKEEPELLGNFEDFLSRVTGEIKRSHTDLTSLESALRNKNVSHDEEVKKLYEEMEQQIRHEKERILAEEKSKERQLREEMERELNDKDVQLGEILQKHKEMEDKLHDLSLHETETKQENDKLNKEKEELEQMLLQSQRHLEESRSYINQLRQKQRDEKRERAMAAFQISEGIALERESLVKQLDMLRDMNKRLRDDKDEADMRRTNGESKMSRESTQDSTGGTDRTDGTTSPAGMPVTYMSRQSSLASEGRGKLVKQGSLMSNYFGGSPRQSEGFISPLQENNSLDIGEYEDDDIECDDFDYHPSYHGNNNNTKTAYDHHGMFEETLESYCENNLTSTPLTHKGQRKARGVGTTIAEDLQSNGMNGSIPDSPRSEPVGANSTGTETVEAASRMSGPERVFKVVFVGDSGVGKSSYIHRFCNNTFKATFSATIGVDFQVKSLMVEDHLVALQLWDTAGQERFRSFTKQYFRKADGVLVMYDVTTESSFTNVRNWMSSVQDGAEEGTIFLLVGNKTDLSEDDTHRVVKTKDGAKLADEYGALFYETSAKSGNNVEEALKAMASLLREKEDLEMEKALSLNTEEDTSKKGGCCS